MSPAEVLREIESRGLTISAAGADLRLQGPRERMDAALIGLIRTHKAELVAHLSGPAGFPLTDLQRAYLVGRDEAFEIGGVASHVYHEIEGCWDVDRLEAALRSVVARHGVLRTRFTADGTQVQEDAADVRIERLDLRGQPEAAQHACRVALREQRSHRILPAERAPLLAAEVTVLAGDRMVLHVSHDGLVLDAISMFLLFRAWWAAYRGEPDPDEQEAPFEAYVAAVEAARTRAPAQRARAYWLERLDDVAPHPDLPLAASPSTIAHPRFTASFVRLDAPAWADLRARAGAAGLTPSALLLAAYAETLARWGAGPRFTINATVAVRPPIHPRILGALGNFGEILLVEVDLDRRASFADRARALQTSLRRSLDNRHFSGIEVMRELARQRGGGADSRMPYTFNSALGYAVSGVDGSALELFGPEVYTSSQTPQVWLDVTAFEQHGGVVVEFDSVDGLHPDGLVEALVGGYRRLLEALREEAAWSATTFDLLLPAEQRERRRAANDTAASFGAAPGLLHEAFLAQSDRAPDAPAILTSAGAMSYAELRLRATHAAAWLRDQGVRRDEPVGLVMRRGTEQLAGILATLIAGAAYLPVDAALPLERQAVLLADGGVRCVLSNVELPDAIAEDRRVLELDAGRPIEAGAPAHVPPAPGACRDDLAYVLYTSGTTGVPKGVMVSHRSVSNVVADCARRFRVGPADRFFGISAFNFDLSVYDVFGALSAGAAVVLPDPDGAADPAHWLQRCGEAGVTIWNSVPAIVAMLCDQAAADGPAALAALRLVMMSGDRIPPALPAALRELTPEVEVVSLGGPTETTIWNVLYPIEAEEDGTRRIPYGRPNANNRAYIVDADGCDTPDWVAGEILAAGAGLARGYWGDASLTAERFRDDPARRERIYRTGDLGRYLPSGDIDILGRTDFQIKLNGYRIEAGEVEARLDALDGVRQSVVVRQGGRLVAHLVPVDDARPADAAMREALRRQLPEVMVPSAIVWHDALPLTRNGKVDRAKLTTATAAQASPGAAAAPSSELEREVAEIWARMLKTKGVDVATSLYDLGGDSLAAARILTAVRKRYGITITLERLAEVETVRAMAAQIAIALSGMEGAN